MDVFRIGNKTAAEDLKNIEKRVRDAELSVTDESTLNESRIRGTETTEDMFQLPYMDNTNDFVSGAISGLPGNSMGLG